MSDSSSHLLNYVISLIGKSVNYAFPYPEPHSYESSPFYDLYRKSTNELGLAADAPSDERAAYYSFYCRLHTREENQLVVDFQVYADTAWSNPNFKPDTTYTLQVQFEEKTDTYDFSYYGPILEDYKQYGWFNTTEPKINHLGDLALGPERGWIIPPDSHYLNILSEAPPKIFNRVELDRSSAYRKKKGAGTS